MRQAGLAANCVNLPHCAWYNEPHIATVSSIGRTVISRHFSNTSALVCRADVCEPANHPSACLEWLAASFITFPVGDLHQLCVYQLCVSTEQGSMLVGGMLKPAAQPKSGRAWASAPPAFHCRSRVAPRDRGRQGAYVQG